jgi:hypothetical protein
MLCAFDGPPRIMRLHGRSGVVQIGEAGFDALNAEIDFSNVAAAREASRAAATSSESRIPVATAFRSWATKGSARSRWRGSKARSGMATTPC